MQLAVSKQSKYGWSPLLVAAQKGHIEIVEILLKNNARSDVFEEVSLWIYWNINTLLKLDLIYKNGKSALHLASEYGHCDVVNLLLKQKLFINAKTKNGFTPLHLACQNGHTELVKLLLNNGSDAQPLTLSKKTPLHLAAQNGNF